jgi:N-methylhydantoinase B
MLSAGDSAWPGMLPAPAAVKRIIERFENNGGINPDDIFLLNDPYLAAIHQSDVCMISPIHFRGQLVGWSATLSTSWTLARCRRAATRRGLIEICTKAFAFPALSWSTAAS